MPKESAPVTTEVHKEPVSRHEYAASTPQSVRPVDVAGATSQVQETLGSTPGDRADPRQEAKSATTTISLGNGSSAQSGEQLEEANDSLTMGQVVFEGKYIILRIRVGNSTWDLHDDGLVTGAIIAADQVYRKTFEDLGLEAPGALANDQKQVLFLVDPELYERAAEFESTDSGMTGLIHYPCFTAVSSMTDRLYGCVGELAVSDRWSKGFIVQTAAELAVRTCFRNRRVPWWFIKGLGFSEALLVFRQSYAKRVSDNFQPLEEFFKRTQVSKDWIFQAGMLVTYLRSRMVDATVRRAYDDILSTLKQDEPDLELSRRLEVLLIQKEGEVLDFIRLQFK